MPKLLAVDDEPNVLYALERGLSSDTLEVLTAQTAQRGLELAAAARPDVVVLDVRLPDLPGLEAFDRLRALDRRLPVIFLTAHGTTETAIEAMKRGAFDYLLKPVDVRQLRAVVARAVESSRLSHVPAVFAEAPAGETVDRIVGRSPAMQEVYKAVGRVAARDMTVLITGESGTGKELVARALYQHGPRAAGPFLAINCAAIPETLLESELFGHEQGAFTGAERRRIGKFEQADGGTLFLDEVGDMTAATQAKVLRVLQEQRFERLGGGAAVRTDVRVIAATNQDLEGLVAAGRYRADLYYRLHVFAIRLPPLRERLEDLPLLAEYFLQRFAGELGRPAAALAPETLAVLRSHPWPGNVRELQSALKYGLVHAGGEVLTPDCLPPYLVQGAASAPAAARAAAPSAEFDLVGFVRRLLREGQTNVYEQVTRSVDRLVLAEVLGHVGGNQVQASELLGISRTTLRSKLRALQEGPGADGAQAPQQP